jgi:diguanylate cyclase
MSPTATTAKEWKARYLDGLDKQDKQQQMMALLVKTLLRISLVAEGWDQPLDKQLAGIRAMLLDGKTTAADLNTLVSALDGQIKRLATVKTERAKAIAAGFKSIVSQLQQLQPEKAARQQLQQFEKQLKTRSQQLGDYSVLLHDYAGVQTAILSDKNIHRISKPFWHRWQPDVEPEQVSAIEPEPEPEFERPVETGSEKPASLPASESCQPAPLSAASDQSQTEEETALAGVEEALHPQDLPGANEPEPPFSRLNAMVCAILQELLKQIEPPPTAIQNYNNASQQLTAGLNWYELVPTLEDVSMVVVSAFDQNQKEFEGFLNALNSRLLSAFDYISASQQADDAGRESSRQHTAAMREQVSAIQQSVASSTGLDQLKTEVNTRLDSIVAAMDQHQSSEQQRASSLAKQLDALVDQVKTMEVASAEAELRIEEQRQKALRDVLTQLPNREAYEQRLELEQQRWLRYQRPLTLVVCDIDHFKQVNDNFGHLAGDKVLRIIAKTLTTRLRKTDFVGRYGGEEFVLLMPETDGDAALQVSEGVREAIASCPFHFKEQQLAITMSFGLAEFYPNDQGEEVFARADKALYAAKEQGRNRCIVATGPVAKAERAE